MKMGNSAPLSAPLRAELEALSARPESSIDTSDIPEVTDWSQAQRGRFHRFTKQDDQILDIDVLNWFLKHNDDHRARINEVLRDYIERHEV
jgi:uncharacterized protein (DUF4415 family)